MARSSLVVPGEDARRVGADLQAAIAAAGGRATVGVAATERRPRRATGSWPRTREARRCLDTLSGWVASGR